jgi:hypothetical protein
MANETGDPREELAPGNMMDTGDLPAREGWGEWDMLNEATGEVQCFMNGGDYGVRGIDGGSWEIISAEDGEAVDEELYTSAEEAMRLAEEL